MDSARTNSTNALEGISPKKLRETSHSVPAAPGAPQFRDVLRQEVATTTPVTFSAHAQARLRSRNIQFTPDELDRLNTAVDKVAAKGGREALFLIKSGQGQQTGLLVSVKNRVVITAVDEASMRENVFTNIDSAAIV